ncbi:MAG: alpha/beta hydrolase, partial [bacterium]
MKTRIFMRLLTIRWLAIPVILFVSTQAVIAADVKSATGEELFQQVDKEIRDQVPAMLREGLKEVTVEMGIPYVERSTGPVKLDVYRSTKEASTEPKPAVVVIHGGSWKSGDRRQLGLYAASLARRGYIAFAIDYRLALKHSWPAQWEDVRNALMYVRREAKKYGMDPDRIGAVG